jgi:hypothetical protein
MEGDMDTSEIYIKMCEKSPLQNECELEKGDWAYYKNRAIVFIVQGPPFPRKWYEENNKEYGIKLFRQDQLQEMIPRMIYTLDHFFMKDSVEIFRCCFSEQVFCGDSFEQVLLYVVMKKKFNKVWNGEDWIEEGDQHGK